MRLIDADELMEHAWRDKLDSRELIAGMIEKAPTIKEIPTRIPIDVFEKLISQQPRWIPVSERLPEEHTCANRYVEPSDLVLITTTNGDVTVSRYWGNRWGKVTEEAEERGPEYYDWVEARLWTDDVTAWMPLPKPYTGGEINADN